MHALYTEGIYRKSGSTNKIKELRQGLDTGEETYCAFPPGIWVTQVPQNDQAFGLTQFILDMLELQADDGQKVQYLGDDSIQFDLAWGLDSAEAGLMQYLWLILCQAKANLQLWFMYDLCLRVGLVQ